jgi:hypothetical protein
MDLFQQTHLPATPTLGVALLLSDGTNCDFVPQLLQASFAVITLGNHPEDWLDPQAETWVRTDLAARLCSEHGVNILALCGTGTGGHAALRLAFRHHALFPAVATWNAMMDLHDAYGSGTILDDLYASREACRQDTAILQIRPFHTPPHIAFACEPGIAAYRGNDRLHEKLRAIGVAHTFDREADAEARMVTGVVEAMAKQSRRLI